MQNHWIEGLPEFKRAMALDEEAQKIGKKLLKLQHEEMILHFLTEEKEHDPELDQALEKTSIATLNASIELTSALELANQAKLELLKRIHEG